MDWVVPGLCDLFQGLCDLCQGLFCVGPVFYPAELDFLFYHKRIKIESRKRKEPAKPPTDKPDPIF